MPDLGFSHSIKAHAMQVQSTCSSAISQRIQVGGSSELNGGHVSHRSLKLSQNTYTNDMSSSWADSHASAYHRLQNRSVPPPIASVSSRTPRDGDWCETKIGRCSAVRFNFYYLAPLYSYLITVVSLKPLDYKHLTSPSPI